MILLLSYSSTITVKDVKVKTCELPVLKVCLRKTDFNLNNYISYS